MKSWVTLYTTYMHVTVCVYMHTNISYVLDVCVHMPKYVIIFWQRSFQEQEQAHEEDDKQQQQQSRRVRVCATACVCVCASVLQTHIPNKYNEYKFWYKWCQERRSHNKYLNIIINSSKIEEEQQK